MNGPGFGFENKNPLEKEKELLENLRKIEKFILEAVQKDVEYRTDNPECVLTEEQFAVVFEKVKHSEWYKQKRQNNQKLSQSLVDENREEIQALRKIVPKAVSEQYSADDFWAEMDVFNFLDEAQKFTKEHWEVHSRELLGDIFTLYDNFASSKFTTSLDGSASVFEEGWLTDEKYKSLYYTFPLSNGSLMSRRFKMVMILNHGIKKVIEDMADIVVFINLNPNGHQKDSFVPQIGLVVQEYFSGIDLVKNELPHKVSTKEVQKVKNEYTWKYNHQGTEIDEIIFQK